MLKSILRPIIVTALVLFIPLYGIHYIDGWNWDLFDFVFAAVVICGSCLAYELVARRSRSIVYRVALGLGVVTAFVLVWMTAAVQIIGDESPANGIYLVMILGAFIGALITRFQARALSYIVFALAVIQMTAPVIALIFWPDNFAPGVPGVFFLNAIFAALWIGSGLLFRRAASR